MVRYWGTEPKRRDLYTLQIENTIRDRNGNIVKQQFLHYSAPTSLPMARALASSLKQINRSYRIVENDGQPVDGKVIVVEQWLRSGWEPTTEVSGH